MKESNWSVTVLAQACILTEVVLKLFKRSRPSTSTHRNSLVGQLKLILNVNFTHDSFVGCCAAVMTIFVKQICMCAQEQVNEITPLPFKFQR